MIAHAGRGIAGVSPVAVMSIAGIDCDCGTVVAPGRQTQSDLDRPTALMRHKGVAAILIISLELKRQALAEAVFYERTEGVIAPRGGQGRQVAVDIKSFVATHGFGFDDDL